MRFTVTTSQVLHLRSRAESELALANIIDYYRRNPPVIAGHRNTIMAVGPVDCIGSHRQVYLLRVQHQVHPNSLIQSSYYPSLTYCRCFKQIPAGDSLKRGRFPHSAHFEWAFLFNWLIFSAASPQRPQPTTAVSYPVRQLRAGVRTVK